MPEPAAAIETDVTQASESSSVNDSVESQPGESIDSMFYPDQDTPPTDESTDDSQQAGTDVDASSNPDGKDESGDESPDSDATDDQGQQAVEVSVDDLAAALNLKPENFEVSEDGQLLIKAIVDGKPDTVTPEKLLGSYQYQKHLDNKAQEANAQLEAIKEQQTQAQEQHAQKLQDAEDLFNIALQELGKEFNDIDWKELADIDPGDYAAKRMQFNERQQHLNQQLEAIQKQRDAEFSKHIETLTAEANKKLVEAFPEWSDKEVATKAMTELRTYGVDNYGFDQKMMDAVTDHRIFQLLTDAQKFHALKESKPEVKNMVRRAVKVSQASKTKPAANKADLSNEDFFYGNS